MYPFLSHLRLTWSVQRQWHTSNHMYNITITYNCIDNGLSKSLSLIYTHIWLYFMYSLQTQLIHQHEILCQKGLHPWLDTTVVFHVPHAWHVSLRCGDNTSYVHMNTTRLTNGSLSTQAAPSSGNMSTPHRQIIQMAGLTSTTRSILLRVGRVRS